MRASARGAAVKLQQEEHMENYTKISAAEEPRVEQLKAGDWVRIAPAAKRQFFASAESGNRP